MGKASTKNIGVISIRKSWERLAQKLNGKGQTKDIMEKLA